MSNYRAVIAAKTASQFLLFVSKWQHLGRLPVFKGAWIGMVNIGPEICKLTDLIGNQQIDDAPIVLRRLHDTEF